MDETLAQRPKAGKYLTVGDILDMADDLKRREVPRDRIIKAEGVIGWGGEVRGLIVKMHQKGAQGS